MIFADTHTHLYLEEFNPDRDAMISRALEAGVRYLFLPNIDSASEAPMLRLVRQYPSHCFAMAGLHPTSVKEDFREELSRVEHSLRETPDLFCAVGEIGIDLYWDKTFRQEQEEALHFQLELALKYQLPAVIHTRNSMEEALEICADHKVQGIFHCFSGNLPQAERAIALGYKLGIGGVITFRNSGLQQVVQAVPLESLVLETDAPFLAPVPHRGKRNEPAYLPLIAAKIAEIKGVTVEEVAEVTIRGAGEVFVT
jgi:TatD DNase family protein